MLEKGNDYTAEEIMLDQLGNLHKVANSEETTTKEKIEISLAMVSICATITRN